MRVRLPSGFRGRLWGDLGPGCERRANGVGAWCNAFEDQAGRERIQLVRFEKRDGVIRVGKSGDNKRITHGHRVEFVIGHLEIHLKFLFVL